MPVSAKKANGKPALLLHSAGMLIRRESSVTASTAYVGTRWWLRRLKSHHPGMARSRENAYQVREALVRPAMPQKICPMVAIRITALAAAEVSALSKMGIEPPPPALIALTSVAAKTNAS